MAEKTLSFHEWESLFFQEQAKTDIVIESIEETAEVAQEVDENTPQETEDSEIENDPEINEALEKLKKLCRVCSSNGLISISSHLTPKLFSMKPSGDMRHWQVPISKIIAEVSGEKVRKFHNLR